MATEMDETTLFFGLMLPLLCDGHAEAMAQYPYAVQFVLIHEQEQRWTLTGGTKPWVVYGDGGKIPDLVVAIARSLIKDVVSGKDVDLESELRTGRLGVRGNLDAMRRMELTFADAMSLLDTMAKR